MAGARLLLAIECRAVGGEGEVAVRGGTKGPSIVRLSERQAGRSEFSNQGQRVLEGQRLIQAASDIFLGWLREPPGLEDLKVRATCTSVSYGTPRPQLTSRGCGRRT